MTDAHRLIKDDALEMMAVLRMNREFMEFMKKRNNLFLQQFGKTIVEIDDDASA